MWPPHPPNWERGDCIASAGASGDAQGPVPSSPSPKKTLLGSKYVSSPGTSVPHALSSVAWVVRGGSPHFTEKKTEALGGQTTYPRSHSWDQTATRGVAYGNMGPSQAPAPHSCPGEHSEGHRYMDCETLGACPATGSREQPLLSVSPEGEQLHRNRWCLGLREPPECPVRPVSCAVRGPAMGSVAWGTQAGQSPCMQVLANPRLSWSVLWVISWESTNIR